MGRGKVDMLIRTLERLGGGGGVHAVYWCVCGPCDFYTVGGGWICVGRGVIVSE